MRNKNTTYTNNALFEDLMDTISINDVSNKRTASQRLTDTLGDVTGLYNGDDVLGFEFFIAYNGLNKGIFFERKQHYIRTYDCLLTLLDEVHFIKRYAVKTVIESDWLDDIEKKNLSSEEFEAFIDELESYGTGNFSLDFIVTFDADEKCSQMRFYIDMKNLQQSLRVSYFGKVSNFTFSTNNPDSITEVALDMNSKLPIHKLNQIYSELYPDIVQKDYRDDLFYNRVQKYIASGRLNQFIVLDWIDTHPADFGRMKMRYLGYQLEQIDQFSNVATYNHFIEFYGDVKSTTNDMIAFIERYVINHINSQDISQLHHERSERVGTINFYIICSDSEIDDPKSTEFSKTLTYKKDDKFKFNIYILNESLRKIDVKDGEKVPQSMNVMSWQEFEGLKNRYNRMKSSF